VTVSYPANALGRTAKPAFSSDGVWFSDGWYLSSTSDGAASREVDRILASTPPRKSNDWTIQQTLLLPESNAVLVLTPGAAGTLALYSLADFSRTKTFGSFDAATTTLQWMPGGQRFLLQQEAKDRSWERDAALSAWSLETGERVWSTTSPGRVGAIGPDGKVLASFGGKYNNGDLGPEYPIELIRVGDSANRLVLPAHVERVTAVTFSPDSKTLVSGGSRGDIKLWSVADGTLLRALTGHDYPIWDLVFLEDGQVLASRSQDGTVRFWKASTGDSLGGASGVTAMVASRSGRSLISVAADGMMRFWNALGAQCLGSAKIPIRGRITGLGVSPDQRTIALAGIDSTVVLYNLDAILPRGLE
jgi:WD40 repeat protein